MRYGAGKRIKVVNINYHHTKRVQLPLPKIIGTYGSIIKVSPIEEKAFHVKLDNGKNVLLYDDEIDKQV